MQVTALTLAESVQTRDGVEYTTVTAMEQGPAPLLQMFDYTLRADELAHKGKLVGKVIVMRWDTIRALFSGRPQIIGAILSVGTPGK